MASAQVLALPVLTLPMAVVTESQTQWEEQELTDMLQKTNRILSQCHIKIRLDHFQVSPLSVIAMDYETFPLARKYYEQFQLPVLFLVTSVQTNQSAGLAPGADFLFISKYSRSSEYKQKRPVTYEPLAHELGHLLGNLQHLDGSSGSNLMAGYIANQSDQLTGEQCLKMRMHPHLLGAD